MPHEKSVGAIVFSRKGKEKKFLLLQYGAGYWDFPKGHIETGETEQQAMLRELQEETGIAAGNAKIIPAFKEHIHYFFKLQGKTVFKEVVFFLVEAKQMKVKISFEHHSFKWLPLEGAIAQATHKTAKQLLQKAGNFLKQSSLHEFK